MGYTFSQAPTVIYQSMVVFQVCDFAWCLTDALFPQCIVFIFYPMMTFNSLIVN